MKLSPKEKLLIPRSDMKQSIKICIIVFAAIAIVGLLFYFTERIANIQIDKINPKSFVSYIEARVNKEIKDKPYEEAKASFYQLIGEINTESYIRLNDSTKALADNDSLKCKRICFYEYAPIFTAHGLAYFNQQSWTLQAADALRDEANTLLVYGIAEGGTQVKSDLDQIVKNVKEYHEALGVVSSASKCETVDDVNRSVASASKYKHSPLTNNKKLLAGLNNVPSVAKDGLVNKLVYRSNAIISRPDSYYHNLYTEYFEDYNSWMEKKTAFENAFGANSKLTNAKSNLEQDEEGRINRMN